MLEDAPHRPQRGDERHDPHRPATTGAGLDLDSEHHPRPLSPAPPLRTQRGPGVLAFHDAEGVPAYIVFSDAVLRQMATRVPKSAGEMLALSGVGTVKLERYGEAFLEALREA